MKRVIMVDWYRETGESGQQHMTVSRIFVVDDQQDANFGTFIYSQSAQHVLGDDPAHLQEH